MQQTIQYKGMVRFGDTIRIVMTVKERKETKNPSRGVVVFDVPVLNQKDEPVIRAVGADADDGPPSADA